MSAPVPNKFPGLADITALLPASQATIHGWLARLFKYKAAVAPGASAFDGYVEGVIFALGDQPALIWTDETLRAVMLTCKHWPEISELAAVLLPIADRIRLRIADPHPGKAVGSRDYMHRQVAAPEPPPPLRDQIRMGKRYTDEENERLAAEAERKKAEQLAELGHEPDVAIRLFTPGRDPLIAARERAIERLRLKPTGEAPRT